MASILDFDKLTQSAFIKVQQLLENSKKMHASLKSPFQKSKVVKNGPAINSSFSKNKKSQTGNEQQPENQGYLTIEHRHQEYENESQGLTEWCYSSQSASKKKHSQQNSEQSQTSILYVMPKACLNENRSKIFHPDDWNIHRFEIGRPLGRGKFGHVYLAREKQSKQIVAIKVLSKKQIVNSEVIPQIRRQIEIHTHLNHPNILKMFGFFFDERKIYCIMEYASGGQLYKVLKAKRKFEEKQAARYIKQMVGALIHIHSCNVFHRDIKPQNILVCADDQLKISDFGWSVRALTTQRKTMCGTMDYLCPEIVENRLYDSSVDIWALGVLAYELTTGNAPFYNKDRQVQYRNIRSVNIKYPGHLSEQCIDFIGKLLQKKPHDRMSLEEALEHCWITENTSTN